MSAPLPEAVDVVVVGSGAAGLTSALTAALSGLSVLVLERTALIGGTSARSSGTVWVPGNPYLGDAAAADGLSGAEYLQALVGERGDPRIWRRFLEAGPRTLSDLGRHAGIRFTPYMQAPDYRQDCPGAAAGGRALEPLAFDGRKLGPDFQRLAPPLPELMLFGGMMVTRGEAARLLRADRSLDGFRLGASLTARYLVDRVRYQRGTRLVLGNALVARLLSAGHDRGVKVATEVQVLALTRDGAGISGVRLRDTDGEQQIRARRGVVLAGGGFPSGEAWRAAHLPQPVPSYSPAAPGADGSTLELAVQAGASLGPTGRDNAFWFPSSVTERRDGTMAVYPHIVLDRAKPGLIAVDSAGKRFVNEAVSYHEFVRGMYAAHTARAAIPAWLVCNRRFISKYGLGLIRPRTPVLSAHLRSGYLKTGATLPDLARQIGVDADGLSATVARFDESARRGADPEFGRGETIYDRANGDPAHGPNPSLGPVDEGPYFAVAVWPTPLGTSLGVLTDADAQALDPDGAAIEGLFVCGNDMQSVFGGEYPGGGAQLGQGMTFGWLAGRRLAGVAD